MGMSYRAAMVPMMLTVVGTVLTPTSVTDTVGMGILLATFFTPNAWVNRMANKTTTAMMTVPTAIATHKLRRPGDSETTVCGNSLDAFMSGHPRDNFFCPK